ncbi:MAG: DUF3300 domain-containing protein [Desulfatirhabdiaceae bacterium]|nr:DUF3300 domain-containing protein [Desulfatirhabdiaceae bacterium]
MVPVGGLAQDTGSAPPVFRQEELDQMLAPIALYPDSLLIQVLMAATYPLEVVQAARWVERNPNLKGEKLAIALDQKYWDPSVKSLVNFPSVLAMMNDKLDWTQDLGDAFLGQKDQVMASIQNLRLRAQAQGTLQTTNEQVVVVQEKTIVIESVSPQFVYVPAYNPTIVYGTWWYPAYPPYYYYPPGYAVASASIVSFGVGVAVGAAWGYAWGSVNWASNQVYVNPAQNVTINNTFNTNVVRNNANINVNKNVSNRFNQANINAQNTVNPGQGPSEWRHDPTHRKGVAYKDPSVRQQFGQTGTPGADARKSFRGFDQGSLDRPAKQGDRSEQLRNPSTQKDRSSTLQRNETTDKDVIRQDRQTSGQRKSAADLNNAGGDRQFKGKSMDGVQRERPTPPQNRSSGAIENLNRGGGEVRQQSDRGRSSRESLPTQRPSQSFQGGKVNPGGAIPNTGSSGGGGAPKFGGGGGGGSAPKFGGDGGGGFPNIGGGGRNK